MDTSASKERTKTRTRNDKYKSESEDKWIKLTTNTQIIQPPKLWIFGTIMSRARSNLYALPKEEEDKSYEAKEARETVEITKPNSTLLNKIGDEINNLEWWCDGGDTFVKRSSVHRILDKYKAESKE